jgi:hypothetical protein
MYILNRKEVKGNKKSYHKVRREGYDDNELKKNGVKESRGSL